MRISDWSSDVCSSDLEGPLAELPAGALSVAFGAGVRRHDFFATLPFNDIDRRRDNLFAYGELLVPLASPAQAIGGLHRLSLTGALRFEDYSDSASRSEEHTSELQSLMRISYAVFCLKKKKN